MNRLTRTRNELSNMARDRAALICEMGNLAFQWRLQRSFSHRPSPRLGCNGGLGSLDDLAGGQTVFFEQGLGIAHFPPN